MQKQYRTVKNVELWRRLGERPAMWHLSTANDLDHQWLLDCLKLSTHDDLVVVALLDDELQTVLLTQRVNRSNCQ